MAAMPSNCAAPSIAHRGCFNQMAHIPAVACAGQRQSVLQFAKHDHMLVQSSLVTIKTAMQDGRFVRYCSGSTEHPVVQQYVADYANTILQSVQTTDLLFQTSNEAAAAWCYRVPEQLPVVDVVESAEDQSESDIDLMTERVFNKGRSSCFQAHGPFIYVHWFGTVPSMQRKGYGGQVMKAITDTADAEKKWTYLEASDQGYHLYIQHGFKVLEELQVTLDAPVMLGMGRPPQ